MTADWLRPLAHDYSGTFGIARLLMDACLTADTRVYEYTYAQVTLCCEACIDRYEPADTRVYKYTYAQATLCCLRVIGGAYFLTTNKHLRVTVNFNAVRVE